MAPLNIFRREQGSEPDGSPFMVLRLIRFLSGQSIASFGAAMLSSLLSGLLTMGTFLLLFKTLRGKPDAVGAWWEVAAIGCLALATRSVAQSLLGSVGRRSIADARLKLGRAVADAPIGCLERIGAARLIGTFGNDATTIASAVPNLVRLGSGIGFVAACLIFLGWLSLQWLALILAGITLGAVVSHLLRRKALTHMRVSRERWDDLLQIFRVVVEGSKELKLDRARRERVFEDYGRTAEDLRESSSKQFVFLNAASFCAQAFVFVALGALIVATDVTRGVNRDLLITYCVLLIYTLGPLRNIGTAARGLIEAALVLRRLDDLGLRLEAATPLGVGTSVVGAAHLEWTRLELVDVMHTHRGSAQAGEFTLGPISIGFVRSEILFIVGGNGSGKTTLAKLVAGLYAPQAGEIRLDGRRIVPARDEAYREQFAAVFSDAFVFDEAATAGDPAIVDRAVRLIERFGLAAKVRITDGRFSTTALSLGERKRLALIHAYLQDRPIYLFDEWSAEQDPAFKSFFYRDLLPELRARGKLVIVISHDDRFFDVADRLLVLERGLPITLSDQSKTLPSSTRSESRPSINA